MPALRQVVGRFDDEGQLVGFQSQDRAQTVLGAAFVLGGSGQASTVTGTTAETVLASVNVPGGLLWPGGMLRVTSLWSMTGSTNVKTFRNRYGGFDICGSRQISAGTTIAMSMQRMMFARAAAQQIAFASWNDLTTNASANLAGAIDSTVDQTLTITAQLALAGESVTLEAWLVEVLPIPG